MRSLFISIAVAFVVPFQVRCVRCSFQLLLRSLFQFKSAAFVVHFNCCCVRCSFSSPLRSLFISIAVAFVVPFQVRCVRCSFHLLLRSLFHFKSVTFVVPFQVRCPCCSISSPRIEDMSFKFLPYCCDPLKSHTRKRTRGSLRPMPNSLITKFPSLQLTSRHKICSTCRQKLYKLDPEECVSTTSVECSILSTASISNVPEREADAPEFSGYASTAMTSIAACNQNDEGDETNTCTSHSELEDNDDDSQIMLGDEISCSEIGADSDIEGYRSDEETTDNSNTDPMNSIVHSTQSEISDNELQIDDMSRNENDITKLNETLICYGISPVSKREALRQGKNYGLRKIRRLEGRLSASIKRTVGVDLCLSPEEDAESTIIKQLKEKFNSSLKRSEMVQILTVLPKNWPIRRIVEEFGATNFMARQAKKLVHEKHLKTILVSIVFKCYTTLISHRE